MWLKGNTFKRKFVGFRPKKNWAVLNKLMNKKTKSIPDNFTIGKIVTDPIIICYELI